MNRTIAIGDIHGCSVALSTLLEAIEPGREDVLVTLGDYTDRGPDSRGVLNALIDLSNRCWLVPLRGNHEDMMLAARSGGWSLDFWLACGGVATLASYGSKCLDAIPAEHWAFLEQCQKFYEMETHAFIHARQDFRSPADPEDGRPLYPLFSGKQGVVGHVAQMSGEIRDYGCVRCIDTYAYGGGWLTALEVQAGQVWQANERGELRPT